MDPPEEASTNLPEKEESVARAEEEIPLVSEFVEGLLRVGGKLTARRAVGRVYKCSLVPGLACISRILRLVLHFLASIESSIKDGSAPFYRSSRYTTRGVMIILRFTDEQTNVSC
jgi:hypothetical protein